MSKILQEKTFTALNKAYAIRFPRIQRDFAQGRTKNAKAAAVRAVFVQDLCVSLMDAATPVKMDFIYGEISCLEAYGQAFLPLDGQQRLTTLFLLHWLLSPVPLCQTLKGITYESRRAAMAFCDRLQKCAAQSVIASVDERASDAVKRQSWFRPVWSRDQTVRGMLVMLDALQSQLRTLPAGSDYWDKLCNMQMFSCLQTNSLATNEEGDSLTDRIYLKMNARGLALTPFEIIKSQIVTFLDNDLQLATGWSMSADEIKEKLDQQWLKFFFRNCGDKFDAAMTRFFALGFYLVSLTQGRQNKPESEEHTKWDENNTALYKISDDPFSFSDFAPFTNVLANKFAPVDNVLANELAPVDNVLVNKLAPVDNILANELAPVDNVLAKKVDSPKIDSLIPLFRILQIISANNEVYVSAKYKDNKDKVDRATIEHPSWFMDAIIPSWDKTDQGTFYSFDFLCPSNYAQRTVVYAASVFPFSAALPGEDEQRRFKEWMRVCWNLIQNSTVTSEDKTAEDAVSLIRQFSPHATDIHAYLQAYSIPSQIYAKEQLLEEKRKIEWFLDATKNVSYEQLVAAESHSLLRGRINILLESPETFAPRYARFVQLMKRNSEELKSEKTADASPRHTLQKALITKINTHALRKQTPLPTLNTDAAWREIVINHQAAVRLLLDEPSELADLLSSDPPELWKRRMLRDTALWDRGKHNRKGLVLIDDRVYLYTNPSNMTSAVPLGTSIPELWRKLFARPDSEYPVLSEGNQFSIAASAYSLFNEFVPEGREFLKAGRLYFYPKRLIFRVFDIAPHRDSIVFEEYPPVEEIETHTAESLWQEVVSKCAPLMTPNSAPAVSPIPEAQPQLQTSNP